MTSEYCVMSFRNKKLEREYNEICSSFDFGSALEKVYPLLGIIFENLPYEDLKSTSLVNKTWNRYSTVEMQKRTNAGWLSYFESQPKQLVMDKSTNFRRDSVAFGLIFYNYREIKLQKYLCVHSDACTRITFSEYLNEEIMPKDVDFWVFSCSKVYSPSNKIKGHRCPFTSLFIPNIPDIKIKHFNGSVTRTSNILEENISEDEHIRCILLFTLKYPNSIIKKFTRELFSRENVKGIAIGGGVISHGVKLFQKDRTRKVFTTDTLYCIAFTQNKYKTTQFDAFSLVISDEHDFKPKLVEFKNHISLRKSSCAIRICCTAKRDKDIETAIFKEIFPNTFVVGLDADGEIGWNKYSSWQPEEDIPDAKKQKICHSLCHEYSTIIVILTWGNRI